jgi:hypothetical protein
MVIRTNTPTVKTKVLCFSAFMYFCFVLFFSFDEVIAVSLCCLQSKEENSYYFDLKTIVHSVVMCFVSRRLRSKPRWRSNVPPSRRIVRLCHNIGSFAHSHAFEKSAEYSHTKVQIDSVPLEGKNELQSNQCMSEHFCF